MKEYWRFCVNDKLTWKKITMGAQNVDPVFGAMMNFILF